MSNGLGSSKLGVAINPETGNPVHRTTPEHRLTRVYANGVNVVVVGEVGGQEVSSVITRSEAVYRAQALSQMASKAKYSDEHDHLINMVEQFIEAIKKAKENEGSQYKGVSVSMFSVAQKQRALLE